MYVLCDKTSKQLILFIKLTLSLSPGVCTGVCAILSELFKKERKGCIRFTARAEVSFKFFFFETSDELHNPAGHGRDNTKYREKSPHDIA